MTELDLRSNLIGAEGCAHLARAVPLSTLRVLILSDCPGPPGAFKVFKRP